MMKKLLTGIISVLILCVALAGCGGQTAQTDDLAYIQEKGTLKIGITLFQPMNYMTKANRINWWGSIQSWLRPCAKSWASRRNLW